MPTFAIPNEKNGTPAEVAQLVEHNLAKVGVASSSLVFCSKKQVSSNADFRFEKESTATTGPKTHENITRRGSIICQSSLCTRPAFFSLPLGNNKGTGL